MGEPGLLAQALGQLAYTFSQIQPFIPTYTHLVLSALFPIYAGSHASLSRPTSAAKPQKRRNSTTSQDGKEQEGEDEEEDEEQRMEGLTPGDALMFPVLAGCTLAGLYFLIKWLQDPAILNKVLNWYFAAFGVISVARLLGDAFGLLIGCVFPNEYVEHGVLWQVKAKDRRVVAVAGRTPNTTPRTLPLPGALCHVLPVPDRVISGLWTVRETLKQKWTLQCSFGQESVRTHFGLTTMVGAVVAFAASMYYNLVDKPWWLTNLFGFGFCYGAIQLMSPTTFATGALMLSALFFYDVYFVFYTPMMITVAKSLDIPIKLLFPRPAPPDMAPEEARKLHAMLGLGDIVLPGIMIGLALRFDLFIFYLRKQKRVASSTADSNVGEIIQAPYQPLAGRQGDAFWTRSLLTGKSLVTPQASGITTSAVRVGYSFPKPYFHASLTGYIIGLLTTLVFMHIYEHGQPALLYLVPSVLGSLFVTGFFRGELRQMWDFSEAEEEPAETMAANEKKKNKSNADEHDPNLGNESDNKPGSIESDKSNYIQVGGQKEKLLFSCSISTKGGVQKRPTQESPKSDSGQDPGHSPRIKTADGEPPHKMRRTS